MRSIRTGFRAGSFAVLLLLAGCATPGLQNPSSVHVALLGFNDLHGNLLSSGQSVSVRGADGQVSKVPAGGMAALVALVDRLRAEASERTLVVAAGDLVGASPPVSGMFHDEPTIDALNLLGLDFSAVGNHEFDKGRDELLRLQNGGCFLSSMEQSPGRVGVDTCMQDGAFEGARFRYLAANVIDEKTGKSLLQPYAIKRVGGVLIGFVGLTLKETPAAVTPKGVAGLRFDDEAATVNRLIPELRQQGVAFVVVLLHQGAQTTAAAINDASCPGFSGEVLSLADRMDAAVEVVVTGHTHQEYVCRRPDGKLLTQAGHYGRMLTKIDLDIDPASGKVLKKSATTHIVRSDESSGDTATDAMVQGYVRLTAVRSDEVLAQLVRPLPRTASMAGESPLGKVIADAYLSAASGAAYGERAAQLAMLNPGGIRNDLGNAPQGNMNVTYGQLYSVSPFGNSLVTIELTGAQLLRLLEQQWESPQPAGGRVLAVSSGFNYVWDASMPEGAVPGSGHRVVVGSMTLNGAAIEPQKTYRVAVNNFLASGGDNFTVFVQGHRVQEGGLDLDALTSYFRARKVVDEPLPARIVRWH